MVIRKDFSLDLLLAVLTSARLYIAHRSAVVDQQ